MTSQARACGKRLWRAPGPAWRFGIALLKHADPWEPSVKVVHEKVGLWLQRPAMTRREMDEAARSHGYGY